MSETDSEPEPYILDVQSVESPELQFGQGQLPCTFETAPSALAAGALGALFGAGAVF